MIQGLEEAVRIAISAFNNRFNAKLEIDVHHEATMELSQLEKNIGYIFVDQTLLNRALTTKAYSLEHAQKNPEVDEKLEDQEVLCTLGDAVLKMILVDRLIIEGATSAENITNRKQEIEKRATLGSISKNLEVGDFILMGVGGEKQKINEQQNTLAETLEAIIGAIYQDAGFEASKRIIMSWDGFEDFF
jgi:ribonuclease-3